MFSIEDGITSLQQFLEFGIKRFQFAFKLLQFAVRILDDLVNHLVALIRVQLDVLLQLGHHLQQLLGQFLLFLNLLLQFLELLFQRDNHVQYPRVLNLLQHPQHQVAANLVALIDAVIIKVLFARKLFVHSLPRLLGQRISVKVEQLRLELIAQDLLHVLPFLDFVS